MLFTLIHRETHHTNDKTVTCKVCSRKVLTKHTGDRLSLKVSCSNVNLQHHVPFSKAHDPSMRSVGFPAAAGEPPKNLRGFRKFTLGAADKITVSFLLTTRDLSIYNADAHAWQPVSGTVVDNIGSSSSSPSATLVYACWSMLSGPRMLLCVCVGLCLLVYAY